MKVSKIMLIAAIICAALLTGCQTTTVTIQPVEYNETWNQYQFNTVDTIVTDPKIEN